MNFESFRSKIWAVQDQFGWSKGRGISGGWKGHRYVFPASLKGNGVLSIFFLPITPSVLAQYAPIFAVGRLILGTSTFVFCCVFLLLAPDRPGGGVSQQCLKVATQHRKHRKISGGELEVGDYFVNGD